MNSERKKDRFLVECEERFTECFALNHNKLKLSSLNDIYLVFFCKSALLFVIHPIIICDFAFFSDPFKKAPSMFAQGIVTALSTKDTEADAKRAALRSAWMLEWSKKVDHFTT